MINIIIGQQLMDLNGKLYILDNLVFKSIGEDEE